MLAELEFEFFSLKAAKKMGISLDVDLLSGEELLEDLNAHLASARQQVPPKEDPKQNFKKGKEKRTYREKAVPPKPKPSVDLDVELTNDSEIAL